MPPSTSNKQSPMLTENQEKENSGNAAIRSRYSLHPEPHPHLGSSGAKRRPTPSRTPGTQRWEATTKVLSSERRPLKDITTPTSDSDSGLKNGAGRGNSVEKMQGSNPDKRRLNGIGSIARGFINRDTPAIRGSLSLEAPKGCFGFLQSTKSVSSKVRKCSPTPIVRPGASRIRGDGIRTSDPKPKERVGEKNGVLPRSNSDGCRRFGGGTSWSRDRTPRSSNELSNSGPRSLKNSAEIGVKRSKDKSLKGLGEFGLKDSKDKGLRNSGGRQNSPICPTAKSLGERKISRSGSLRTTPSHNGLKKNCGMETRTAVKTSGGNYGLRKGVAAKSSDEVPGKTHPQQGEDGALENVSERVSSWRRQEHVGDRLSNSRCASNPSCQRRAQEMKVNLTAIGSPREKTAAAVHRFQATSSDKVLSDYSHATPAHKFIENICASTPAHRLIGRYGDFTPAHKLAATNGDVTPAHAHTLVGRKYEDCNPTTQGRIGQGGDVTPAPHTIGKGGGDFTPAPSLFGKGGGETECTPAQNTMHATPEQRTQVTPPVQPSISPEIHSQSLDELEGARQCFGAGHVVAPVIGKVRDRRKCRPRGILTVGEATPLPLEHNRRFSLVPVPAAAYVKWMSPGEAKNLTSPSNCQATPSSGQDTPSAGFCTKNPSPQITPSSGFTQGTPSTGFNSSNPSPQATPLSEFSQGTPSTVFSSKSPNSQSTPLSGPTQKSPPTGFSAKNPSPQAIHLSGLAQDPPIVLSLKNLIPQNSPIERLTQAVPLSCSSHFSNLQYTPSSLSPEMQTLHPPPPFGLSTEMKNVSPTSPYRFIEEMPHFYATLSKISPNFQVPRATPHFGLTSDCQHLQTNSPYVFDKEFRNCQVTHNPGSSPPASYEHGFHPHISPQCGDSQGAASSGFSTKIPSQFGCNPDTFPPRIISQGTPPSWNNQIVPSQLAVNSDVVRLGKTNASPADKDIFRQEMQMPISSSEDFTKTRISWREGLMSRIFELGEFDCSDLILEEEGETKEDEIKFISGENHLLDIEDNVKLEYPSSFGNELQLGAPFGSFEYLNKATTDNLPVDDLFDSLVKSHISPASQAAEAESIDTEYVRTSSGDLDWTFWYRNQLFEEAA